MEEYPKKQLCVIDAIFFERLIRKEERLTTENNLLKKDNRRLRRNLEIVNRRLAEKRKQLKEMRNSDIYSIMVEAKNIIDKLYIESFPPIEQEAFKKLKKIFAQL